MGRGKGTVKTWIVPVVYGRMLFQIYNVRDINVKKAVLALKKIKYKLPILTRIVLRKKVILL
jgi:ribosomal protein L16/L10AE